MPPHPESSILTMLYKNGQVSKLKALTDLYLLGPFIKDYKHSNSNYFISIHVLSCDE